MKIVQQSRQVFTSGIDTAKFNATFLFNLIIIVVYVLKISLLCFTIFFISIA